MKRFSALFLLLLGVWCLGCQRQGASPVSMEAIRAEEGPTQESWGVLFQITDGDVPRMHLQAGYMAKYSRRDSTYLLLRSDGDSVGVTAYLFDEAGDSSATVTAHLMRYFNEQNRVIATGNVQVVTQDGKSLQTEHLIWEEKDRRIHTRGFVRIRTPNERIEGYFLEGDENLENFSIGRVTGSARREE